MLNSSSHQCPCCQTLPVPVALDEDVGLDIKLTGKQWVWKRTMDSTSNSTSRYKTLDPRLAECGRAGTEWAWLRRDEAINTVTKTHACLPSQALLLSLYSFCQSLSGLYSLHLLSGLKISSVYFRLRDQSSKGAVLSTEKHLFWEIFWLVTASVSREGVKCGFLLFFFFKEEDVMQCLRAAQEALCHGCCTMSQG